MSNGSGMFVQRPIGHPVSTSIVASVQLILVVDTAVSYYILYLLQILLQQTL